MLRGGGLQGAAGNGPNPGLARSSSARQRRPGLASRPVWCRPRLVDPAIPASTAGPDAARSSQVRRSIPGRGSAYSRSLKPVHDPVSR